jgi:hypothetical protein
LFAALLLCPASLHPQVHSPDTTCDNGNGQYSTRFQTGTTVSVGPLRKGAFAQRACAAKLTWGSEDIDVASDAAQIGIDVLGADLGLGKPVVAFQIDETGDGTHRTYQIYSLAKPPRLLETITGGDSYVAADTDLDGKVEIWTDDASAVDGFEGVPLHSFDFAPTVVLRFEKKHLVDASSEFTPDYDTQIAQLRAQIEPQDLAAFKNSDGVLPVSGSGDELHRLMRTKIKVLEIVWAYLYSGREAEAWAALQQMWPSRDLNRIQAKISEVPQRGILHGVDRKTGKPRHNPRVHIYNATGNAEVAEVSAVNPDGSAAGRILQQTPLVQPKSILLRRPPPTEVEDFHPSDASVELVVDAAGKVRSAKLLSGADPRWIQASAGWHFIPASSDGTPVACRFRLSVWDLK